VRLKDILENKYNKLVIVIFGAGSSGQIVRNQLDKGINVLFCDNDEKKFGSFIHDSEVISPEELKNLNQKQKDIRIIIASEWYAEIYNQLNKMGLISIVINSNTDITLLMKNNYSKEILDKNKLSSLIYNEKLFCCDGCLDYRINDGPDIEKYDAVLGKEECFCSIHKWSKIKGWLLPSEALAIQRVVKMLKPQSKLVEVGSYHGKSTVIIGSVLPKDSILFSVDNFSLNYEADDNSYYFYRENIQKYNLEEKIGLLAMDSSIASQIFNDELLDLVFIDGQHDFKSVYDYISEWYPKIKNNGFLLCHDYSANWPGVKQAIEAHKLDGFLIGPTVFLHSKQRKD